MITCLNKIVGISQASSTCLPLTVEEPLSGLYLDDMTPGKLPLNPAFFSNGDLAAKTLNDAISEVQAKSILALDSRLIKVNRYTETTIGFSDTYTGFMQETTSYKYLVLKPKYARGTTVKISKIKIYEFTGLFAGNIHIIQGGETKYTGTAAAFTSLKLDLNKPIFIAYQSSGRARDFLTTPCCGQFIRHSNYVDVSSGYVDDLNSLNANIFYNNSANGIELEVSFDCNPFFNICNLDFKNSSFPILFAKLIQQTARLAIGMKILSDDKISSYSLVRRDEINNINEYLANDIQVMLTALPEYYNHSDCYTCSGMYIDSIMI
jgi:hypothetical protein